MVVAQESEPGSARDPAHHTFLDRKLERFGTRLLALDDWGDDTHEGELLTYLKGWVSEGGTSQDDQAQQARARARGRARRGEARRQPPRPFRLPLHTRSAKPSEVPPEKMAVSSAGATSRWPRAGIPCSP